MMGFGVDQVLQVEMVLPNGHHVRFGPTKWETAESFSVPRTTEVAGMCRENPKEIDEGKWAWSACPSDANINFDDLWFAVNGGGGGTWGVITSLYLQLHEYLPLEVVVIKGSLWADILAIDMGDCPASSSMGDLVNEFLFKFRFLPETISVPQKESDTCGFADNPQGYNILMCYGSKRFDYVKAAWSAYLTSHQDKLDDHGIAREDAKDCFGSVQALDFVDIVRTAFPPLSSPYTGRVVDSPAPTFNNNANNMDLNVLIPKEWVRENPTYALETLDPRNGKNLRYLLLDMELTD